MQKQKQSKPIISKRRGRNKHKRKTKHKKTNKMNLKSLKKYMCDICVLSMGREELTKKWGIP